MDEIDQLADLLSLHTVLTVDGVHAMARAAEGEIARRGFLAKYARELERLLPDVELYGGSFMGGSAGAEEPDYDIIGQAVTAPPDLRVRAMLKVLS